MAAGRSVARYHSPAPAAPPYDYTDFQRLVHSAPEDYSLFLGGGRGGAKSSFLAQLIGITAAKYGRQARILFIRQGPYKALNDFIQTASAFFDMLWGHKNHSLNHGDHVWTLPTGAYLELGILPDGEHGRRYYETAYQGRSFTHVIIDEAQQFARPDVLDLLVSNLRGPIPTRIIMAANPGGIGHQWLVSRFINNGVGEWRPFEIHKEIRLSPSEEFPDGKIIDTRRTWMSCPSTYLDNPHNGVQYLANLAISCGNDMELLKAWISGNWSISRGAYFAAVMDNPRIRITWPEPQNWRGWLPYDWRFWLAYDHGTAAPAICYVMAKSPGAIGPDGVYYPAGSIVILDEFARHREGDLSRAYNETVPQLATMIKGLAKRWQIPPKGVADDACFGETGHEDTIAGLYQREGITWRKAHKGLRAPRFQEMKRLMSAAGRVDEEALYVSTRCRYFWDTVPFLVHDPADPEVPLKCSTDHGLDAASYGLSGSYVGAGVVPVN